MHTTLAIVGTAGRKEDADRLSKNHFEAMCQCARLLLQTFNERNYNVDMLVSGGAAWADHVAVKLYLNKEIPNLKLFFPCSFDRKNGLFDQLPLNDSERAKGYSTGEIINRYHTKFSRKCGFSSLSDISLAIDAGAETVVCKGGFFGRNALVAQSDVILAMTFGEKEWLKDGGTAHTVKTYLNRVQKFGFFDKSFHYNLNDGEVFWGAKVKAEEPLVS